MELTRARQHMIGRAMDEAASVDCGGGPAVAGSAASSGPQCGAGAKKRRQQIRAQLSEDFLADPTPYLYGIPCDCSLHCLAYLCPKDAIASAASSKLCRQLVHLYATTAFHRLQRPLHPWTVDMPKPRTLLFEVIVIGNASVGCQVCGMMVKAEDTGAMSPHRMAAIIAGRMPPLCHTCAINKNHRDAIVDHMEASITAACARYPAGVTMQAASAACRWSPPTSAGPVALAVPAKDLLKRAYGFNMTVTQFIAASPAFRIIDGKVHRK